MLRIFTYYPLLTFRRTFFKTFLNTLKSTKISHEMINAKYDIKIFSFNLMIHKQ